MEHKNQDLWWMDENFWDEFAPLMFDPLRWQDASIDIDNVLKLVKPQPSARILDAGCGPGRHSLELARRGYRLTGIDMQSRYIESAVHRAEGIDPKPQFIKADLREYTGEKKFDGAISMFQSIGYTENPDDDLAICRRIFESLSPGAWFVMESDGKEAVAGSFEERTWFERDGKTILLEYEIEAAWSRLRNHWQYRDEDGHWHECDFSYRLYSAMELGRLLEAAGFSSIEFFGGLDGRPYDNQAINLVALARRA